MFIPSNLTAFSLSRSNVQSLLCHTYKLYRAPQGCLQYFTGVKSTVTSFNWDGTSTCTTGCFLGSQQYAVCFRPEKGIMLQLFTIQRLLDIKNITHSILYNQTWHIFKMKQSFTCISQQLNPFIGMCGMGFATTDVASTLDAFLLTTSAINAGVRRYTYHFIVKHK